MSRLLRGWPPQEMMRSTVVSGRGGSTQPSSAYLAAALHRPAPSTPKLPLDLVAALPEPTQQPLVFVTFNVTSLA
eukprot:4833578-Prorocentrum_lima.AAC.1